MKEWHLAGLRVLPAAGVLPAGHGVRLVLTETGEDYLAPACGVTCPITVNGGTLSIPHLDRDGSNVLITPQGEDAANNQ